MAHTGSMLTEFELIRRYFSDIHFPSASFTFNQKTWRANEIIALGIGDDAAILNIPDNMSLVFSIDTQLADIHFPAHADPEKIAQRAFRCAVSDLAAMGAQPLCFTLALTLPDANPAWLEAFSRGLKSAAKEFSCSLVGGDTTRGPLCITIQVHGLVEKNSALLRSCAQPEDVIVVSGSLGDSAGYVQLLQDKRLHDKTLAHAIELFEQAYFFPASRITLGRALRNHAQSAIDISDGLLADLGHICECSRVRATLQLDRLPLSPELVTTFGPEQALQLALSGGDDYELCFTIPERKWRKLQILCDDLEVAITAIGHITEHDANPALTARNRVTCYDQHGKQVDLACIKTGYSHF